MFVEFEEEKMLNNYVATMFPLPDCDQLVHAREKTLTDFTLRTWHILKECL